MGLVIRHATRQRHGTQQSSAPRLIVLSQPASECQVAHAINHRLLTFLVGAGDTKAARKTSFKIIEPLRC